MIINRRDSLRFWIEGSWGNVGWKLQRAKTVGSIRKALMPVDTGAQHAIQVFVRPTKVRATAEKLRMRKRESADLFERVRVASHLAQQSLESLTRVEAAAKLATAKRQKKEFQAIQEKRKEEKNHAQKDYEDLLKEDRLLDQRLADERAFFAQNELLHFLQSGRYSFTPIKLANAMAGLPDMGWRQSAKRCAPFKSRTEPGPIYWLFLLVQRAISDSQQEKLSVLECVEQRLQNCKDKKDYRLLEAKRKFYHLKRAIEGTKARKPDRGSLPYRIIAKYQSYATRTNAVESFLEQEQQLK